MDASTMDASTDGGPADAGVDAGPAHSALPQTIDDALLLNGTTPMPCADPAVLSTDDAHEDFFVFCTSMAHVWQTTDWETFQDLRASMQLDLTGLDANGKIVGHWWAPGVLYDATLDTYLMWVSVPAAVGTATNNVWSSRSIIVLTASAPTGPWTFRNIALEATVAGQQYIDPFLFVDHDGKRYVFWKQYGGGLPSEIVGAEVSSDFRTITSAHVNLIHGWGGNGTWEDNVRENPAVHYDPATQRHHLIFSGGHWNDDTYATGHAASDCGPLCIDASNGGYRMIDSGDRQVLQVVRTLGLTDFAKGGAGGAVFVDSFAEHILYAAAARSSTSSARVLMLDRIHWANGAPYVDNDDHHPAGW